MPKAQKKRTGKTRAVKATRPAAKAKKTAKAKTKPTAKAKPKKAAAKPKKAAKVKARPAKSLLAKDASIVTGGLNLPPEPPAAEGFLKIDPTLTNPVEQIPGPNLDKI